VNEPGDPFPHARWFSAEVGIPEQDLVRGLAIERVFHEAVLKEPDVHRRRRLYADVYATVHEIYRSSVDPAKALAAKLRMVKLFRRELHGRSILDVGCGAGYFLRCVASHLPHDGLLGIDIDLGDAPGNAEGVAFMKADIIDFSLDGRRFDVVFSDNVAEHMVPADTASHFAAMRRAAKDDGTLVVIMPHRMFGPWDVTRIVDNTHTNRVASQGTHLNEGTYSEVMQALAVAGFGDFRSIIQLPKLTYRLGAIRISPWPYLMVERRPWLLRWIYRLRWGGQTLFKFNVVLICRAKRSAATGRQP
jgi:SAM-dependent methyltransferase